MHPLQAAVPLFLANHALAAQFTKTSASVGHPFLKYDAFLFDGLGTLHDNVHARPYAAKAIEALQAAGKLVIVGSNAPHTNNDEPRGRPATTTARLRDRLAEAAGPARAVRRNL